MTTDIQLSSRVAKLEELVAMQFDLIQTIMSKITVKADENGNSASE